MSEHACDMTQTAADALERAREVANNGRVNTAHVLFGLLQQDNSVAFQVLQNLGITPDELQAEITRMFELKQLGEG